MGNQILVDNVPVSLQDVLQMNVHALSSSWTYSNTHKNPILFRMWRLTEQKDNIKDELLDFISEKNIGIGFSRDDAYISLVITDLNAPMSIPDKLPFYTKMFLDSLNNIVDWSKNNSYQRKYDNYSIQIMLIKGKRLSSPCLLKSLSTYFKLENKLKQAEQKFIQALFEGAILNYSKLIKRQLTLIPQQKVQCPIYEINKFQQKSSQIPVLKQIFKNKQNQRFNQLPIEHGINYWYLFNQETVNSSPFQLDITNINPQNQMDFSDFENQLQLGMQGKEIIIPQLGDMSLSLLNQLKPIVRFQMPKSEPIEIKDLKQNNFYLLCKQKQNGVDIVMWQGQEWSRDSAGQGDFMQQVISTHFGKWPANQIFLHSREYNLN